MSLQYVNMVTEQEKENAKKVDLKGLKTERTILIDRNNDIELLPKESDNLIHTTSL